MPIDIVAPKKDLLRVLERVAPIADRKSSIPLLANVLLDAGKRLRVSATDLYLGMAGECDAEVANAGTVALPAKDLLDRVKAMPEGPIQIASADGALATLKAVGQPRRYTVYGLPGQDFPMLPKPGDKDPLVLPAETFALLMARTHFSISTDETRAHVNSALFEWQGSRVRMVSTDGHRLSRMEAKVERDGLTTMLLPLNAIHELRRLVDVKGESIEIRQGGPNAFFDVAGFRFSVKLVDATFPPYQQVVPQQVKHTVIVPRLAFIDALKAVQVAASDKTGGVKIALGPGVLRVTAESPESGSAADEIAVDCAAETQVGVNAKYMLDCLSALDCEEVEFGVSGELDPMTLRPQGNAGDDFVGVLMPMRLG